MDKPALCGCKCSDFVFAFGFLKGAIIRARSFMPSIFTSVNETRTVRGWVATVSLFAVNPNGQSFYDGLDKWKLKSNPIAINKNIK